MKILYVSEDPHKNLKERITGGGRAHIWNTIEAFRKLDCDVLSDRRIIRNDKIGNAYRRTKKYIPSIRVLRDLYKIYDGYRLLKHNESILIKECPNFIYERNSFFRFPLVNKKKRLGIPTILEINAPVEELMSNSEESLLYCWAKIIERQKMGMVDTIITVSSSLREYIVKEYNVRPNNVYVLPNGVDPDIFYPNNDMRTKIRNRYRLEDKLVVGFVGKGVSWHRIDFLIKAAPKIIHKIANVRFVIVGGDKDKITNLIEHRWLKKYFVIFGSIPYKEIPWFMNAMDICVMPGSNWYGSPVKLFEYGAIGKPVLFPNVGPVRDVIKNKTNGLLFETGNIDDFTNALLRLLDSMKLRCCLGDNFRKHILDNHTWAKNAEKILKIYNTLRNCKTRRI